MKSRRSRSIWCGTAPGARRWSRTCRCCSALDQTEGAGRYRAQDWLALLRAQLATLDVGRLIQDVRPFLERPADARLLEPSNLGAALAAG